MDLGQPTPTFSGLTEIVQTVGTPLVAGNGMEQRNSEQGKMLFEKFLRGTYLSSGFEKKSTRAVFIVSEDAKIVVKLAWE